MTDQANSYPRSEEVISNTPRHIGPDIYVASDSEGFQISLNRFATGGGVISWHDENGESKLLKLLNEDPEFKKAEVHAYQESATTEPLNKKKYLKVAPLVQVYGLVRAVISGTTIVFENDELTQGVPELSVGCDDWESVNRNLVKLEALHISGLLPKLLTDAGFVCD